MQTYEEQTAIVKKLNIMDDVFFQKIADDTEVCSEILQVILGKPKLRVISAQTQRFLRNTGAHSVILDLLCEDENGSFFNVEVQKTDEDDYQKRLRFNLSNIDTSFVEKGISYDKLPDVYLVFLSTFDIFKENRTIYHVERVISESGSTVNNGVHEIYVNTSVNDHSDIAELMQYFKDSTGEHPKFPKLSGRVKYFKESQEGVNIMTQVVEDYAAEKVKNAQLQMIINMLKNGATIDFVEKTTPVFTRTEIQKIKEDIQKQQ